MKIVKTNEQTHRDRVGMSEMEKKINHIKETEIEMEKKIKQEVE